MALRCPECLGRGWIPHYGSKEECSECGGAGEIILAGKWFVVRHSGRNDGKWRVLIETADEEKARKKYEREYEKMRQGGVQLVGPDGEIVKRSWAPRVRTRW